MPIKIRKHKEKVNLNIIEIRRFLIFFDLSLFVWFKRIKTIKKIKWKENIRKIYGWIKYKL